MFNRSSARASELSLETIARVAPSVFASEPFHKMSERYRFVPTVEVINAMMKEGFRPVAARQGVSRIPGKGNFTKHQVRFRHADMQARLDQYMNKAERALADAPEVAELVLTNSHDGTSAYILDLGFFRLACSNGLMVQSSEIESIRSRHSGSADLVSQVLEGSFKVIEEAPKAVEQIERWKGVRLSRDEQVAYAEAALVARDTSLEIPASRLVLAGRTADAQNLDGSRDLYRTFNVVQEALTKGGIRGRTATNRRSSLRGIQAIDADTKLNKALWTLTEKMEALKGGAKVAA